MLLLFSFISAAFGQDFLVPNNGTLQQVINAAANGDVIGISQLEYGAGGAPTSVTVNGKTLTIQSAGGSLANHTITVTGGANLTLRNILMQGTPAETNPDEVELGRYCVGNNNTFDGVVVQNSTVTLDAAEVTCFATGIDASNSDVVITDSSINANYPFGGVVATNGTLSVDDSDFSFNFAYQGGGIRSGAVDTTITNSTFYANSGAGTGAAGGGVYVASENAYISSNEFANNFNLIWYLQGNPDPSNADLAGLAGDSALFIGFGDGAGLYVRDPLNGVDATVEVHNNLFCGNLGNRGAGLFIDDVKGVMVRNNTFADGWAMSFGGGFYILAEEAWTEEEQAKLHNNTFLNNTAGILPPPFIPVTVVIGGGGAGFIDGTVLDFRNNIVAFSPFGGGLAGIDGADYTIGDFLTVDFNIFYNNCDVQGCSPSIPGQWQNFTGDLAQIALPATNIALDPFPTYFGSGEFVCIPDAFYPRWGSPAVRSGDRTLANKFSAPYSDIGAYGGPEADVLDRDNDLIENIYDCNDDPLTNGATVLPGASEQCDGFDNNCDGQIDEGFDTTWYPDGDGDGYGDADQVQPIITCNPPADHVLNRDDCDDSDPYVNPAQPEICNGMDDDCDFVPDNDIAFVPLYPDQDNDNYGATGKNIPVRNGCRAGDGQDGYYVAQPSGPPLFQGGLTEQPGDCNDNNNNISPLGVEVCDGVDNDCNGTADDVEGEGEVYYPDADGDGYGVGEGQVGCAPPGGSAPFGGDCNDADATVNPGADEVCTDDLDNDCDGLVNVNAVDAVDTYIDADGDGFGDPLTLVRVCPDDVSPNAIRVGGDCDDNDPNIGQCAGSCGCQATPSPSSMLAFGSFLAMVLGLRRRRAA